jgi:hypothetical protein
LAASVANAQSTSRGVTTWEADEQFFLSLNASYGACPNGSYISAITFGGAPTCTSFPPFGGTLLANLNFNGYLGTNMACPTASGEAAVIGCGLTLLNGSNVGVGLNTLGAVTIGSFDTAVGGAALLADQGGSSNTAVGYSALRSDTSGNYNTAVGFGACSGSVSGSYDICLGVGGGGSGSNNILIGNNLIISGVNSYQLDIGDTIYGPLVGSDTPPTAPIIIAYGIEQTPQTPAPSTAVTFNWATANNFIPTQLTANTVVTFTNTTVGQHITVIFTQAGTGGPFTVTWPTVRWLGGTPPTMSTASLAVDRYDFYNTGSNILGVAIQGF